MAASTERASGTPAKYAGGRDLARASEMSLGELARRANESAAKAHGTALYHVACTGVWLLAARAKAPHGEWHDWLSLNWRGSVRQADRYMEVAEACGRDPGRVEHLDAKSIRGVIGMVSKPTQAKGGQGRNRSRVTDPPILEADYTLTTAPEPAQPPVKLDSLDAPVVDIVAESKRSGAATAPGAMTSRLFSAPQLSMRKEPDPPAVAPRPVIVAVAPRWLAEVVPLLSEGLEKFRHAFAVMGEARMQPAPIPNDDGYDIRFDTYEAQAVVLRRMVEVAEKDVRDWSRVASDTARDEPGWITEAAGRRRAGEVTS